MPSANPNFDALATTTLNNYSKTLEDNVFADRPLLAFLNKKKELKSSPGAHIQKPLLTGKNTTVKSYSMYDTLDISAQEGISTALYDWKSIAVTVAIAGEEEDKNSGEAALIDLFEAKVTQAQESLSDALNVQLFGDGTGNSAKDFDGLRKAVAATAWGGIDPAIGGNEFWKGTLVNAATTGTTKMDPSEWTSAFNTASKGANNPDFAVTTQGLFEVYEAGMTPNLRYTQTNLGDARFTRLEFKGLPLYFDAACPTGYTYFLNSRYIGITGMKKTWFRATPFKYAADKDAHWSQILLRGNLTVTNRSRNAAVYGQTLV